MLPIQRLSFSGCGWLFPYHVGVLAYLKSQNIVNSSTILSGVSGGALVAVAEACGLTEEEIISVAADIVKKQSCSGTKMWGNMSSIVEEAMMTALPDDAHIKSNSRVSIAITQVSNTKQKVFVPLLSCLPGVTKNIWSEPTMFGVSNDDIDRNDTSFRNKHDLIQGCLASSHIPYYMDNAFSKKWRNLNWVDGGMKNILPAIPKEHHDNCIQSLPYQIMTAFRNDTNSIISPSSLEFNLFTELLPWSFIPSKNVDNLYRLRDVGYKNAESFVTRKSYA